MNVLYIIEIVVCSLLIIIALGSAYVANKSLKIFRKQYDATDDTQIDIRKELWKSIDEHVFSVKACLIIALLIAFFLTVAICSLILL